MAVNMTCKPCVIKQSTSFQLFQGAYFTEKSLFLFGCAEIRNIFREAPCAGAVKILLEAFSDIWKISEKFKIFGILSELSTFYGFQIPTKTWKLV